MGTVINHLNRIALPFTAGILVAHYATLPLRAVAIGLILLLLIVQCCLLQRRANAAVATSYNSQTGGEDEPRSFCDHPGFERLLFALLCFYPLFVLVAQLLRTAVGAQGVDFAIYLQSIYRASQGGSLECSLFGTHYYHFLTHHFSPYLYLFVWGARYIQSIEVLLLLTHSIGIACSLWGIYVIAVRVARCSVGEALLWVSLFVVVPVNRIALLWEVHDETYALPLVIWSFYALLADRRALFFALLVVLSMIKETMFLVVAMFGIVYFLYDGIFLRHVRRQSRTSGLVLFCLGVGAFLLYTKILPGRLFTSSFQGFTRIVSLQQALDPSLGLLKIRWLSYLLLPFLPLLFSLLIDRESLRKRTRWLFFILPGLPMYAAIALTNFDNMLEPYNYYTVIPASVLIVVCLAAWQGAPWRRAALAIAVLIAAVMGPRFRYPHNISAVLTEGEYTQRLSTLVTKDAVVVVDDYEAALFYKQKQIIRLFHANKNVVKFDFVIQRKAKKRPLSRYLRSWSTPCFQDDIWEVRCALPRVKPGQSS